MSAGDDGGRRRILDRWRLVSPTGAEVVSLRQLPKRERLRLLAPSIFTTLNMVSGFSSVLLAFRQEFTLAAILIAFSIVMDIADGFVARLVGATSPFGLQLDSLADLISFGLAPAVLVHTWALDEWPLLAWLVAFFWLACAAFRLARFNVTIDPLDDKRYFIGLPSPGAAAVVMATIFALDSPSFGPGTRGARRPWRSASRSCWGWFWRPGRPAWSSPTASCSPHLWACSRHPCACACSGRTRWPHRVTGSARCSSPSTTRTSSSRVRTPFLGHARGNYLTWVCG